MKNAVQINRDPFARASLMRLPASGSCAWCGQPARFRYYWEDDGRLASNISHYHGDKVYCSVGCFRIFVS